MRAIIFGILVTGAVVAGSTTAAAQTATPPPAPQDTLPPPAANGGNTSGSPSGSPPAAAQPTQALEALPPPVAGGPSSAEAATGTPVPAAVGTAPNPDEWRFSYHGYFRAPLRIGVGHRDNCAPGMPSSAPTVYSQGCAGPGQSRTTYHSPYVPDDQYLSWNYDRQWEQAWTEMFFSYGNNHVVGTVGVQGYDFTDTTLLGNQADPAQFGIGQAWVTVTPDLPVDGLRMNWKIGAFWEKFGQAGKYDAGAYDTYMFGRTHVLGESLGFDYDVGDVTFHVRHGFGAHLEMVPAGVPIDGALNAQATVSNAANIAPLGGAPGYTLLDHVHAGISYKKWLDINAHYMVAWEQDDREESTLGNQAASTCSAPGCATPTNFSSNPDGSISVVGAEARLTGGVFGELYVGYSHVTGKNVVAVGPALEVVHSSGGGGHNAGNGLYENFLYGIGDDNVNVDTFEAMYTFSFGYLWRKLQNPHAAFWGDGADVKLALFTMYSAVSGLDATNVNPFLAARFPTANPSSWEENGAKKLKYGADLVANVLPWLGFGVRGDYVQPDSKDVHESFGVISPKLIFRTKFITHEEITAQYSRYFDGADVIPQQYLALIGSKNIANFNPNFQTLPAYPNDEQVFGIKATMWW